MSLRSARELIETKSVQLFELLRLLIKEGSATNDVPILDPLQIEHQEINYTSNGFTIQSELYNMTLLGLGDFEILDTTFDKEDISLELNMRFPLLSLLSERYVMAGDIYSIFPLLANGFLNIEAHDLIFRSKIYLTQSADGKSILIDRFIHPQFEVDTIVSRTEFDGNIDDILNAMIEDLLADYLTRFSKYIAAQHEHDAKQFLNQYLTNFESWRLIAAILMKLLILLTLCALAAALPKSRKEVHYESLSELSTSERNFLINLLIRQLIEYVRNVIKNGSDLFGLPPLDPLDLESFRLQIPAGIANLDLDLQKIFMTGLGGFVVHKSELILRDLSFEIDLSVPKLDISTEIYDFTGDLFDAIPLYGKGNAAFQIEEFRLRAKIYLKQSDNEKSIIIDRIENATFELPSFKSNVAGAIGGGDIDVIVNAVIQEVVVDYINRFRGAISNFGSEFVVDIANPYLNQLDTWRFIERLL
ncbi:hypothetical protein RR46_10647 [Papilio xuthus]|uniref:Uncharacterized protein n=2 Tax=Papilio xuthus TaxID=66420 RepID=A0A194PJ85_PAPXU|nr:hypothetical protein RR46_10647 [Papilio xuthus]